LSDKDFLKLEKEYRFLKRAREFYRGSMNELERECYAVVDIETTGLNPEENEIIEIGALLIQEREIKDVFSTLISGSSPIPPEIEGLTGIKDEFLKNEPSISQVLPSFLKFIGEATLVVHNVDFDIVFLKTHISKILKTELNNKSICTLKVAKVLLPNLGNYKLHTVAEYLKIPISTRHRAIGDAEITYQIWMKFLTLLKDKKINTKSDLEKLLIMV